jgi:hypothetical protein
MCPASTLEGFGLKSSKKIAFVVHNINSGQGETYVPFSFFVLKKKQKNKTKQKKWKEYNDGVEKNIPLSAFLYAIVYIKIQFPFNVESAARLPFCWPTFRFSEKTVDTIYYNRMQTISSEGAD